MRSARQLPALLLCLFSFLPSVFAQETQSAATISKEVTIVIEQQRVRFTVRSTVEQMQLQVFNQSGEVVYDSGVVAQPEINWRLQNGAGEDLKNGLYAYTLSIKEAGAEATRIRRGHFIVDRAKDRDGADKLWITSQDDGGVGTELTVARDDNATVAGVVIGSERTVERRQERTSRDGSGRGVEPEDREQAEANKVARMAAAGTVGQIAKFTSATDIGDSVIREVNGRVGVGTTNPSHQLSLGLGPSWTSNGWGGALALENASAIGWKSNVAGNRFGIGQTNGGLLFFRSASDPGTTGFPANYDLVINDSGNVGIGTANPGVKLEVVSNNSSAVLGTSTSPNSNGVIGVANNGTSAFGVRGSSTSGLGVVGISTSGYGVRGVSTSGYGVNGASSTGFAGYFEGKLAVSSNTQSGGDNTASFAATGIGPWQSHIHYGTTGDWFIRSAATAGKVVLQDTGGNVGIGTANPVTKLHVDGSGQVEATIRSFNERAILALSNRLSANYYTWTLESGVRGVPSLFGIYNRAVGRSGLEIDGSLQVTVRSLRLDGGADLAENFDVRTETGAASASGPAGAPKALEMAGMVVSIDPQNPGKLRVSSRAYDRRVAGIISGAGGVKPGMVMGQEDTLADGKHPVALSGRVYVWADATRHAIKPGDLLTTSATPGHAMKAANPQRAQGAIIGKAMTGLKSGKGLVLALITLQ